MTTTDRRLGVAEGLAVKAPVRVATTAAITLSGEQTIDGVAVVSGDRVLVKNQSSGAENGVYDANTGTWTRAVDFNGQRDVVSGTRVYVAAGSSNGGAEFVLSNSGAVTIGTTALTFTAITAPASATTFTPTGTGGNLTTLQERFDKTYYVSEFTAGGGKTAGQRAAEAAYAQHARLHVKTGEEAFIICDPSGGDDLQSMANWITACSEEELPETPSVASKLYIQLADGGHTLNNFIDVNGPCSHVLAIRASGDPDYLAITAISYASVSGTTYRATITTSTELPARFSVGDPVGILMPVGDNDAASAGGGQIIQSIAGDRLSFTFDFSSPKGAPTSPSSLTAGATYGGVTNNQVVCPKAWLICQSTGWGTGLQREGWLNLFSGATTDFQNFGIAYSGAALSNHDLIYAESTGTRFYCRTSMVIAGAGDFVLRAFQGAEMRLNQSCIGGAAKALALVTGVVGSNFAFVRCTLGGANDEGLAIGSDAHVQGTSCILASCIDGIQTNGGSVSWRVSKISNCTNGVRQTNGIVELDSSTESIIERCTTGIRRSQTNGFIIGAAPNFSGNTTNSTIQAAFAVGLAFTPTLTNGANVASSSALDVYWDYARTTNEVFGRVRVTPTAGSGTKTVFNMSLPIATTLTNAYEIIGTGVVHDLSAAKGTNVSIIGDTGTNDAEFTFFADSTSLHEIFFRFKQIRF